MRRGSAGWAEHYGRADQPDGGGGADGAVFGGGERDAGVELPVAGWGDQQRSLYESGGWGRIWGSTTAVLSISNAAYADGADYRVVVSNFYGSASSVKATLTVTAPPPVAAFGLSATSVGTGVTVYFTNLTTGVWDSVLWTFGDGASSTGGVANGAVVSHAYSVSNSYTVYLEATNSGAGLGNIASHALLVTNSVSGAVQGNPGFASVKLSGTALTIVITNVAGSAGRPFNLLGTNNVAAARNTWPVVTNGVFAGDGGYTNTLQTTNGTRQFYLIQVP